MFSGVQLVKTVSLSIKMCRSLVAGDVWIRRKQTEHVWMPGAVHRPLGSTPLPPPDKHTELMMDVSDSSAHSSCSYCFIVLFSPTHFNNRSIHIWTIDLYHFLRGVKAILQLTEFYTRIVCLNIKKGMAMHAYVLIPHESLMLDKTVKCPSGSQQIPLFLFVFSQRPASCCCFCVAGIAFPSIHPLSSCLYIQLQMLFHCGLILVINNTSDTDPYLQLFFEYSCHIWPTGREGNECNCFSVQLMKRKFINAKKKKLA